MIRYAVFDKLSNSYIGHRTSCHNYSRAIPDHMITRNLPAVGPEDARLYTRRYDAVNLILKLNKYFNDHNRFEIHNFTCSNVQIPPPTYYIMN